MALIELTADDLCAAQSWPFPCEDGKIIDPIGTAHWLGLVEPTASMFEQADEPKPDFGAAAGDPAPKGTRTATDSRLVMLSLACSMEASQAVTQARAAGLDAALDSAECAGVTSSLGAFVDGVIASPPEMTTVLPSPGTVIVVGTIIIKIPSPPPIHPRWEAGEQLGRTDLLAMAARFQSASEMPGVGAMAEDLAGAASRLIDAAITR